MNANWTSRTELLFGGEGVQRLKAARVAVIGLGGVGSFAVEALVRSGIGRLRLIDGDRVSADDINRQLIALPETVGRGKAKTARGRIHSINPDCRAEVRPVYLTAENAAELIDPSLDAVVDAIDDTPAKLAIFEAAAAAGLPVISSMGAARKTDPAHIRRGGIWDTSVCPLARAIRRELRHRGLRGERITCIYSTETPAEPTAHTGDRDRDERPPMGSFIAVSGIFGLHAARETVTRLLAEDPTR